MNLYILYCDFRSNYKVSKAQCEALNLEWNIYYLNFDDIKSAILTTFMLSTMDNWANLLLFAVDSDLPEKGPSRYNNQFSSYTFFLGFIIIVTWLFYNLFIGVIFSNFVENSRKNISNSLSPELIKWLDLQPFLLEIDSKVFSLPKKKSRYSFYNMINLKHYQYFVQIILILNFVSLVLYDENKKKSTVFHILFIIIGTLQLSEVLIYIYLYRTKYFLNKWNIFLLIASIAYIPSLFASYLEPICGKRIMRLIFGLRVLSLFRIIEKVAVLKKLILKLLLSWRLLLHMLFLLFIVIIIYALLGVILFKHVTKGEVVNEFNNFKNLFYALQTLFKCLTREEWTNLVFDMRKTPPNCTVNEDCGSEYAYLYFISFTVFNTYIIFNMFILILLQQFEEFNKESFNPLATLKQHLEHFKIVWNKHCFVSDRKNKEEGIHCSRLLKFFIELGSPLGLLLFF